MLAIACENINWFRLKVDISHGPLVGGLILSQVNSTSLLKKTSEILSMTSVVKVKTKPQIIFLRSVAKKYEYVRVDGLFGHPFYKHRFRIDFPVKFYKT